MAASGDPAESVWKLPRERRTFDEAKRFSHLAVAHCGRASIDAATMAVWELIENLSKYGEPDRDGSVGTIAVSVTRHFVRIRTSSVATAPKNAQSVVDTISRINAAPSVIELYRQRLRELYEDPHQISTRLGLLRVAFEGGFRLSCSYDSPRLEIIAERAVDVPK